MLSVCSAGPRRQVYARKSLTFAVVWLKANKSLIQNTDNLLTRIHPTKRQLPAEAKNARPGFLPKRAKSGTALGARLKKYVDKKPSCTCNELTTAKR